METYRTFWTWAYIIGISSFYVMVVVVIPRGLSDLLELFRNLQEEDMETSDSRSSSFRYTTAGF